MAGVQKTVVVHPNLEAELGVIAILLADNHRLFEVADRLRAEHFGEPFHRVIFNAVTKLINEGLDASPVTLRARIETHPSYEAVGGSAYLERLAKVALPASELAGYTTAVIENFARRQLDALGEALKGEATQSGTPLSEIAQTASDRLKTVTESLAGASSRKTRFTFGEAVVEAVDHAASAYQHLGADPNAVKTGLGALDHHMGGFSAGDLIIIAGRPSMGKSALAGAVAYNVARSGIPAGFISLEMSAMLLAVRNLSAATPFPRIPYSRILKGKITEAEFTIIADTARDIANIPLEIVAPGRVGMQMIEAEAMRLKNKHPKMKLLVLDYLQLIPTRGISRNTEIGEITAGLKGMAKSLDLAVVALSQLSRQVESRDDKRPQLSDLRESGSIEQDADTIIFPYRDDYYLARQEPRPNTQEHFDWQGKMEAANGIMDLIIAKFRMGATGTVRVKCEMSTNSIFDLESPQMDML